MRRREFIHSMAVLPPLFWKSRSRRDVGTMRPDKDCDVAVIGSGVFGAWTAYSLNKRGKRVLLLDAHGPGNSRASSGGESRVIRMGYGADELYTRWSLGALERWQRFCRDTGHTLFHQTGVLWMGRDKDPYLEKTAAVLQKLGVPFEKLERTDLEKRFPQIYFDTVTWGVFEPKSGALMARRAVQAVTQEAIKNGVEYLDDAAESPSGKGKLKSVRTRSGMNLSAETYIFACGPWLPKLFPALLGKRIYPTRQEVFFFGTRPGDRRFAPPAMPAWIDFGAEMYGIPDLENRGFKVAPDRHGPAFDPDLGERVVTPERIQEARRFIRRRFPSLEEAPVLEARVCQYENTSNGDFLIDRHPEMENVWLVGGGSGHGFKHGPSLGDYVAQLVTTGGTVEPRFTLATKETVQKRSVY